MAGEWIPMREDIHDDPVVLRLSAALGYASLDGLVMGNASVTPGDATVGFLHRMWSWFSRHTTDGKSGLVPSLFEKAMGRTGFVECLVDEGWLEIDECTGTVNMGGFESYLGRGSKKRLAAARRQSSYKQRKKRVTRESHKSNARASPKALPTEQNNQLLLLFKGKDRVVLNSGQVERLRASGERLRAAGEERLDVLAAVAALDAESPGLLDEVVSSLDKHRPRDWRGYVRAILVNQKLAADKSEAAELLRAATPARKG